jgi:DNA (cytosine-5)-methyltransferase 1
MGFDPDRESRMDIPVSDTRAYKQFGNAVVVPVVAEIARYMKPHILRIMDLGELFERTSPAAHRKAQQLQMEVG